MMVRRYRMVVAVLLLAEVYGFGEGASNPGFMARITQKGLDYAHYYGVAALKEELSTIRLPDLSGKFKAGWFGSVSYEFYRLRILHFKIPHSDLSLLPGQGVRASLSNNYLSVSGNWKAKKHFITLQGTFDLTVDDIFISVSLNLNKDNSGRLTVSVDDCSSSIGHVSIDISGHISWILNLFHESIENKLKTTMQQKICKMIKQSSTSHLKPYLQTLPVTSVIDQVAAIDYSLVEAPQVTSNGIDIAFKGEFFRRSWRSPVPFSAPAIQLPQKHDHMVYFAVSEYVFNTASYVYHQAGHLNFTIYQQAEHLKFTFQNEHVPLESLHHPDANSLQALVPWLARLYPNMEIKLEISPESAPFLMFTPGKVTFMPVMDIQAFTFLPNSNEPKPLFQFKVRTNISATINMISSRIVGSVATGSKMKLELKHSNIGFFNEQLMEAILNYYTSHVIYPSLNAKLEKGFSLPLPKNIYLSSSVLQIHKNFLLFGANIN